MYHVLYDGVVMDEQRYSVLGGSGRSRSPRRCRTQYTDGLDLGAALRLGAKVLGDRRTSRSRADQLEVALLDRSRPRRAFRRIKNAELEGILASG